MEGRVEVLHEGVWGKSPRYGVSPGVWGKSPGYGVSPGVWGKSPGYGVHFGGVLRE